MDFFIKLNSFAHVLTATLSLLLGAMVLFQTKGSERHKKLGIYYFYCMLLNNVTALFIYNSFGKWFFPHTLAVVTLAIMIPGFLITLKKSYNHWLKIHIVCFVLSYYMLIGGAINEAFLRIPALKIYRVGSPVNGMTHFAAMLFFIGLLLYFLIKYRKRI